MGPDGVEAEFRLTGIKMWRKRSMKMHEKITVFSTDCVVSSKGEERWNIYGESNRTDGFFSQLSPVRYSIVRSQQRGARFVYKWMCGCGCVLRTVLCVRYTTQVYSYTMFCIRIAQSVYYIHVCVDRVLCFALGLVMFSFLLLAKSQLFHVRTKLRRKYRSNDFVVQTIKLHYII